MATIIPNKNPLEIQKRNGIGISLPLNGPSVFNSTYTTKDTIKANLINFILTNQNERVFNLGFGGNLRAQLFSPLAIESAETLRDELTSLINQYFPSVIIADIEVTPLYDQNTLTIKITYNVLNTGITDTIELNFT